MKQDTKIIAAGRKDSWTQGGVNPVIQRASTIIFDSVEKMQHATKNRANNTLFYGRRGTTTSFAFSDAMCEIEGGVGCALYPCGTAAISSALLSFLKTGDHLLMVDTAYEPTRDFCNKILANMGITTTYYDPMIGAGIKALIQDNTRVLFLESPGSNTMEVQDVPTLAAIAHQTDITVMLDNTWGSGINFKPFDYGVDISIQAATKYIVGHSDVMMGTATANEKHWPTLREHSYLLGQCASADDCYLALRGLRTLGVRMRQHEKSALKVAHWLKSHPAVDKVLHPAFEDCPGHEFFKRDFSGGNGLFSFILNRGDDAAIVRLLDGMRHFKMGFSWGGFESLILKVNGLDRLRTAKPWTETGTVIRLHIGLEDVDDLIEDLAAGLARLDD
ncbi:MAG: cystathionine beta-lyase [Psychrobium sp.]|nr:cystathionine beta-lyase [Psychrobium sp.]